MTTVLDFYKKNKINNAGITLEDMWKFSDWELENTPDFITWMFPIEYQFSDSFSDTRPIATLTPLELKSIADDQGLKEKMLNSLNIIENFWGFNVLHKSEDFKRPQGFISYMDRNWLTCDNHNFMRITRVLHSLVLFGLEREALELLTYLDESVYQNNRHLIGERTFIQWHEAIAS